MTFYVSSWGGSGTRADPYRPVAVAGVADWSCIDLRPDVTVLAGYALVWTAASLPSIPSGVWLLADGPDSVLSTQVRNRISTLMGVSLPTGVTFREACRLLMTVEATGPTNGRWKRLIPTGDRLKLVLGELNDTWLV